MTEVLDKKKVVIIKSKIKQPNNYFVMFKNDDYTSMEFVVYLLKKYFNKNDSEAERIMIKIHTVGEGIAGLYPFQLAEQKAYEALVETKDHEWPLQIYLRESN